MKLFFIISLSLLSNSNSLACDPMPEDPNKVKFSYAIKSAQIAEKKSRFKIAVSKNKTHIRINTNENTFYLLEPTISGDYYPTKYTKELKYGCHPSTPPLFLKLNKKTYSALEKIRDWICKEEFTEDDGETCFPGEAIHGLPSNKPPRITAQKAFITLKELNSRRTKKLKKASFKLVSKASVTTVNVQALAKKQK